MKHIREYITDIEFEGKEIEFKLRLSDSVDKSWCKTIAAFANIIGGGFTHLTRSTNTKICIWQLTKTAFLFIGQRQSGGRK